MQMTIYKEIARRFGSAWQFSHTEAAILTTSVVLHMFVCFILFRWEIISHLNQSCFPNFGMAFNPPLLACLFACPPVYLVSLQLCILRVCLFNSPCLWAQLIWGDECLRSLESNYERHQNQCNIFFPIKIKRKIHPVYSRPTWREVGLKKCKKVN